MDYKKVLEDQIAQLEILQKESMKSNDVDLACRIANTILSLVIEAKNTLPIKK